MFFKEDPADKKFRRHSKNIYIRDLEAEDKVRVFLNSFFAFGSGPSMFEGVYSHQEGKELIFCTHHLLHMNVIQEHISIQRVPIKTIDNIILK